MKVKIQSEGSTKSWMIVTISDLDYPSAKEELFKRILTKILYGNPLELVTFTPQDYSFGYDIDPYYVKKIDHHFFLVNNISYCDTVLIEKIVMAEEFRRTLLIIIIKESAPLLDIELKDMLRLVKGELVKTSSQIVFCEDDGNSLFFYNIFNDNELIDLLRSMDIDIQIEN